VGRCGGKKRKKGKEKETKFLKEPFCAQWVLFRRRLSSGKRRRLEEETLCRRSPRDGPPFACLGLRKTKPAKEGGGVSKRGKRAMKRG